MLIIDLFHSNVKSPACVPKESWRFDIIDSREKVNTDSDILGNYSGHIGYHLRLHKPAELLDSRAMFFDKKD